MERGRKRKRKRGWAAWREWESGVVEETGLATNLSDFEHMVVYCGSLIALSR